MESSAYLKQETQKFAFVSRTFLYKTMELIYENRCPDRVADFLPDDERWFFMNIDRSLSLRKQVSSTSSHGWFSIDISISETSEIVERWYLIHLPIKQNETVPSLNTNLKELKLHTYRHFAQILRSIFSMMHCLPAWTLSFYFKKFKTVSRKLVANCSTFRKFPVDMSSFTDNETANVKFGPIITPVGKTLVICQHQLDITSMIPSPIRTAPHYVFPRVESPPLIDGLSVSASQTYGCEQSYNGSVASMTPIPSFNIQSFVPDRFVDGFELIEIPESRQEEEEVANPCLSVDEFLELLDSVEGKRVSKPVTVEQVREDYEHVKQELEKLLRSE